MSTWKLQKLVYYSQAWHLAWDGTPLFDEPIQAWANGPVVRKLYDLHKGWYAIDKWPEGDARRLSKDERETIDSVLTSYGNYEGFAQRRNNGVTIRYFTDSKKMVTATF